MNLGNLRQSIPAELGSLKKRTEIVDGILSTISEALKRGEDVNLIGFGSFRIKTTKEHMGRNPSTGEPLLITAKKKIKFIPSANIKDALNAC